MNSLQIMKMIVTCSANLGNMIVKEFSELKIPRSFTSTDGDILFWRSGTGKFGATL